MFEGVQLFTKFCSFMTQLSVNPPTLYCFKHRGAFVQSLASSQRLPTCHAGHGIVAVPHADSDVVRAKSMAHAIHPTKR